MVRKGGLEPPRPNGHEVLNLARLPIPPLSQAKTLYPLPNWGVPSALDFTSD